MNTPDPNLILLAGVGSTITAYGISEAYDVLSDPKKRAEYDQIRTYGASAGGFGGFAITGIDNVNFNSKGDIRGDLI